MTANELRIGNFIMYSDIKKIFDVNLWFFAELKTKVSWINDFEPIPLTEEWLEKFGFELKDYESFEAENEIHDYEIVMTYDKEKKYSIDYWKESEYCQLCFFDENYENRKLINGFVQYVHQLQNIYFALTGEELTLV
jgi:hypothetical protein